MRISLLCCLLAAEGVSSDAAARGGNRSCVRASDSHTLHGNHSHTLHIMQRGLANHGIGSLDDGCPPLRIPATLMAPALGMRVLSGDWLLSLSHPPADGTCASELDDVLLDGNTSSVEPIPRFEIPLQTLLDQFEDYLDHFPDIVSLEFDRQARFLNHMLESKLSMGERLALVRSEMCPSMKIAPVNRGESSLLRPEALHFYVKIMECVNGYKDLVEARKARAALRIAQALDVLEKECGSVASALEQQLLAIPPKRTLTRFPYAIAHVFVRRAVIDAQLWKEELKNESAAVDGLRQATLKQSLLDLARGISSEASKLVQQSDHSLHEMAVNLAPIFTQYAVLIQVLHSQAAGHIPMLAAGSGAAFPHHKTAQFLEIREPGSEVRCLYDLTAQAQTDLVDSGLLEVLPLNTSQRRAWYADWQELSSQEAVLSPDRVSLDCLWLQTGRADPIVNRSVLLLRELDTLQSIVLPSYRNRTESRLISMLKLETQSILANVTLPEALNCTRQLDREVEAVYNMIRREASRNRSAELLLPLLESSHKSSVDVAMSVLLNITENTTNDAAIAEMRLLPVLIGILNKSQGNFDSTINATTQFLSMHSQNSKIGYRRIIDSGGLNALSNYLEQHSRQPSTRPTEQVSIMHARNNRMIGELISTLSKKDAQNALNCSRRLKMENFTFLRPAVRCLESIQHLIPEGNGPDVCVKWLLDVPVDSPAISCALEVLSAMAAGSSKSRALLVQASPIKKLVALLDFHVLNITLQQVAFTTIGLLIDIPVVQDLIVEDHVSSVVSQLFSPQETMIETAILILSPLVSESPMESAARSKIVAEGGVGGLVAYIRRQLFDLRLTFTTCTAITVLSKLMYVEEVKKLAVEAGVLEPLAHTIREGPPKFKPKVIALLGKLGTVPSIGAAMIEAGVLRDLKDYFLQAARYGRIKTIFSFEDMFKVEATRNAILDLGVISTMITTCKADIPSSSGKSVRMLEFFLQIANTTKGQERLFEGQLVPWSVSKLEEGFTSLDTHPTLLLLGKVAALRSAAKAILQSGVVTRVVHLVSCKSISLPKVEGGHTTVSLSDQELQIVTAALKLLEAIEATLPGQLAKEGVVALLAELLRPDDVNKSRPRNLIVQLLAEFSRDIVNDAYFLKPNILSLILTHGLELSFSPILRRYSIWLVANLATNEVNIPALLEAGAVKYLVKALLKIEKTDEKIDCIDALKYFAREGQSWSPLNFIGEEGAIPPLVAMLQPRSNTTVRVKRIVLLLLGNLTSTDANKIRVGQDSKSLGSIVELMKMPELLSHALTFLTTLRNVRGIGEQEVMIVKLGVVPLLLDVIKIAAYDLQLLAVTLLAMLCDTGVKFAVQQDTITKAGAVPVLMGLIQKMPRDPISSPAAIAISHLATSVTLRTRWIGDIGRILPGLEIMLADNPTQQMSAMQLIGAIATDEAFKAAIKATKIAALVSSFVQAPVQAGPPPKGTPIQISTGKTIQDLAAIISSQLRGNGLAAANEHRKGQPFTLEEKLTMELQSLVKVRDGEAYVQIQMQTMVYFLTSRTVHREDRRQVLIALSNLAEDVEYKVALAASGLLPPLLDLLVNDKVTEAEKDDILHILFSLGMDDQTKLLFVNSTSFKAVFTVLESSQGNVLMQSTAVRLLHEVARIPAGKAYVLDHISVDPLMRLMGQNSTLARQRSAALLLTLLVSPSFRDKVLSADGIALLIDILSQIEPNGIMRRDIGHCLQELTSSSDGKLVAIRLGILPLLRTWINSCTELSFCIQAANFIEHLARSAPHIQEQVVDAGFAPALIALLAEHNDRMRASSASALEAMAHRSPYGSERIGEAGAIPALLKALDSDAFSVQTAAAWALEALAATNDNRNELLNRDGVQIVLSIAHAGHPQVVSRALGTVARLYPMQHAAQTDRLMGFVVNDLSTILQLLLATSGREPEARSNAAALLNALLQHGAHADAVLKRLLEGGLDNGLVNVLHSMLAKQGLDIGAEHTIGVLEQVARRDAWRQYIETPTVVEFCVRILQAGLDWMKPAAAFVLGAVSKNATFSRFVREHAERPLEELLYKGDVAGREDARAALQLLGSSAVVKSKLEGIDKSVRAADVHLNKLLVMPDDLDGRLQTLELIVSSILSAPTMETVLHHILDQNYTAAIVAQLENSFTQDVAFKIILFLATFVKTKLHRLADAGATEFLAAMLRSSKLSVQTSTDVMQILSLLLGFPQCANRVALGLKPTNTISVALVHVRKSKGKLHFWALSMLDHYSAALGDHLLLGTSTIHAVVDAMKDAELEESTSRIVARLSLDRQQRLELHKHGALRHLVHILAVIRAGDENEKLAAMEALARMSVGHELAVFDSGGFSLAASFLVKGPGGNHYDLRIAVKALSVLRVLLSSDDVDVEVSSNTITAIIHFLTIPDVAQARQDAAAAIWNVARRPKGKESLSSQKVSVIKPLVALLQDVEADTKTNAAGALQMLSVNSQFVKNEISEAGAIPSLVDMLSADNEDSSAMAAAVLHTLAYDARNRQAILKHQALKSLIPLLTKGSRRAIAHAAATIQRLASTSEQKKAAMALGAVKPLLDVAVNGDARCKAKATAAVKSLASVPEVRTQIMELGGLQILLQVARKGDVEGKASAVGALLLLSQDKVNVARLSTTANINSLLFLLSTADVDVRMRVAGIFTNLASDRDAADRIRGASVVSSLVEMLHIANEACQSRAALALEALCQVPDAALEVVKSGGLLPLIDMIRSSTPDGKRNAAAVLEQLAQQEIIRATFGDRGGIGALMELSREGTPPARMHAFRALRSLMSNRANQVLAVSKNFIPFFVEMLDIGDMASRSLVVDIIGSMFSGDQALVVAAKVVDAGGVPKLATLLSLREKTDGRLPVIKAFESIAKVEEGALSMLNAKVHTALIQVLESDITKGKGSAAIALRRMAHPGRPDLRLKIAEAGATAALATLMRHATVNFDKIEAAKALLALVEDDTKSRVTGRVDRMDSVLAKFRAAVTPEAIEELARIDNGRNEAKTLAKKLKARLAAVPTATPEAEASVDPTLPHGSYFVAAVNTNLCPSGSEPILNMKDCQSATIALKKLWGKEAALADHPKGCFVYTADNGVYFNNGRAGFAPQRQSSPICIVSTPGKTRKEPYPVKAESNVPPTETAPKKQSNEQCQDAPSKPQQKVHTQAHKSTDGKKPAAEKQPPADMTGRGMSAVPAEKHLSEKASEKASEKTSEKTSEKASEKASSRPQTDKPTAKPPADKDTSKASESHRGATHPTVEETVQDVNEKLAIWAEQLQTLVEKDPSSVARIIADDNSVGRLVGALSSPQDRLHTAAVRALLALASNDGAKAIMTDLNIVAPLVQLLEKERQEGVLVDAVQLLLHLAYDDANEAAIVSAGAVPPLVEILSSGGAEVKAKAAAALQNLGYQPDHKVRIANEGALPLLLDLLKSGHIEGQYNAAAALWVLATDEAIQLRIVSLGGVPALVNLLTSPSAASRTNSAGALWLLSADELNAQAVVEAGGLGALVRMLQAEDQQERGKAAGALWALATHNSTHATIAEASTVALVISLVEKGAVEEQANAAGVLHHLAGSAKYRPLLMKQGAVKALKQAMNVQDKEVQLNAGRALNRLE